jgi:hypothetical protein
MAMTDNHPKCRSGVIRSSDRAASCGGSFIFAACAETQQLFQKLAATKS